MFYHRIDQIENGPHWVLFVHSLLLPFISSFFLFITFVLSDALSVASTQIRVNRRKKKMIEKSRFSIKFETFTMKAIAILLLQMAKEKN